MLQRIGSTQEGNASFSLSGDYYNREFSGRPSHTSEGHLSRTLWVIKVFLSKPYNKTCYSQCDFSRLGALRGALALLPVLAAAGRRPPPPAAPEDGGSCQTPTGCEHHFCSVGYVFESLKVLASLLTDARVGSPDPL